MEKSELVDLIPLYVTGKLSEEQKAALDRELPNSPELRDELAFWQAAHAAAGREAVHSLAGHLTSEQIVDYARGVMSNSVEQSHIEQHLQACKLCLLDFETIRPAFMQPARATSSSFFERLVHGLAEVARSAAGQSLRGAFRPLYVVPLLAILAVPVILLYQSDKQRAYPVSIALQFQTQTRSSSSREVQTIKLPEEVTVVHLSVPIPHATVQPTLENVSLILASPEQERIQLNQEFSWSVGSGAFDTASVSIPASALRATGTYSLRAAIKYTQTSEPFEYNYMFAIEHEKPLP